MSCVMHKWKYAAISILLVVGCVFAFQMLQPEPNQEFAEVPQASAIDAATIAEANAEVFRRIFWRQPNEADKIIQSQRRERAGEEGSPAQWDWFLAVDASADFSRYFLEENPFELTETTSAIDLRGTPDWFPQSSGGYEIRRSLAGEMTVLVDQETRRIYVWNQASAFQKATELPEKPAKSGFNQNVGRLPNASPPLPE